MAASTEPGPSLCHDEGPADPNTAGTPLTGATAKTHRSQFVRVQRVWHYVQENQSFEGPHIAGVVTSLFRVMNAAQHLEDPVI